MTLINEISFYQADLLKSVAIFYLLILGNFITGLFTCNQKNFVQNNKIVQAVIAFTLFYFLVTLVSDTGNLELIPPIQKLLYTIGYFVIFLLSIRLDFRVMVAIIGLVILVYFIELNKKYYLEMKNTLTSESDKKIYDDHAYWITLDWPFKVRLFPINPEQFTIVNKFENVLYYFIITFIILGIIAYRGEITIALHKRKDLSWYEVFNDTNKCKILERLPFFYYVKVGLGINSPSSISK
jgi:hypothetical protein